MNRNMEIINEMTPEIPKPLHIWACTDPEEDGSNCNVIHPNEKAYIDHCNEHHKGVVKAEYEQLEFCTEQRKDLVKNFWLQKLETIHAVVKFTHTMWENNFVHDMCLSVLTETALGWYQTEGEEQERTIREMYEMEKQLEARDQEEEESGEDDKALKQRKEEMKGKRRNKEKGEGKEQKDSETKRTREKEEKERNNEKQQQGTSKSGEKGKRNEKKKGEEGKKR